MTDHSAQTAPAAPSSSTDLHNLSSEELISRITDLESRLRTTTAQLSALTTSPSLNLPSPRLRASTPKKAAKPFDFSRFTTRHIALKFAYLGQRYNGLEHANGAKPPLRPTIEEVMWKALRKARLIPPDVPEGCDAGFEVVFDERGRRRLYWDEKVRLEIDWTGLGYSKCGRTDKGVSAFGQVIGITVRSNRPREGDEGFDEFRDELQYISILNSLLPPDIRVLAWSSDPENTFDARFSCQERRYKYFFTNPAFCPTPGASGLNHANGRKASVREGWLDIEAMRKAAKKLEGLHDFRNFCKIDASKQMSSCERRVTFADIEEMPMDMGMSKFITDPNLNQLGLDCGMANGSAKAEHGPKIYAFAVHGTAFLWHQVRCMVGVLFLVGQGLEQPEIIDQLLDIERNPGRPNYEMADDGPLVLWDCIFPQIGNGHDGVMNWIFAGDQKGAPRTFKKGDNPHDGKFGIGGVVRDVWTEWHQAKIRETLSAGLLSLALSQGDGTPLENGGYRQGLNPDRRSQQTFEGGNGGRTVGEYIPVLRKSKREPLEVQNAKYLAGKQARRDLKRAADTSDEQMNFG